jgi:hypothetical protein
MFWVIFDSSTRREYYQDVHNLLAMPAGSIIPYDYRTKYFSPSALAEMEARRGGKEVLLVYAQSKAYQKNGEAPVGTIPFADGLWVGTRLATLRSASFSVDQYYIDLQLEGYPAPNEHALSEILRPLIHKSEAPFSKWIAISETDEHLRSLRAGADAENWTSIINKLGVAPSQFAGDSFWRISKVSSGEHATEIVPNTEERLSGSLRRAVAIFPVNGLGRLAIEIESRQPQGEEDGNLMEGEARAISVACGAEVLAAFDGRSLPLRRFQHVPIEGQIASTDSFHAQDCKLHLATGPVPEGKYPVGPDFSLNLRVAMDPTRMKLAVLSGVLGAIGLTIGVALLRDHVEWGVPLVGVSVLLAVTSYYSLTGKFKLPGAK